MRSLRLNGYLRRLIVDDIVIRLREYNPVKGFIDWHDTMTTAADEIERLRKERDYWREERLLKETK
jgi:hypothetical protein